LTLRNALDNSHDKWHIHRHIRSLPPFSHDQVVLWHSTRPPGSGACVGDSSGRISRTSAPAGMNTMLAMAARVAPHQEPRPHEEIPSCKTKIGEQGQQHRTASYTTLYHATQLGAQLDNALSREPTRAALLPALSTDPNPWRTSKIPLLPWNTFTRLVQLDTALSTEPTEPQAME